MCCKFPDIEKICTITQTHNHSDLGYLYKAGGLFQFNDLDLYWFEMC